jgi:hypothetical protein
LAKRGLTCWRSHLFREEFYSAPVHSPPLWSPVQSFKGRPVGRGPHLTHRGQGVSGHRPREGSPVSGHLGQTKGLPSQQHRGHLDMRSQLRKGHGGTLPVRHCRAQQEGEAVVKGLIC